MAIMLCAGIDGDLGDLARRSWREIQTTERARIQATVRLFTAALDDAYALRARWSDD